MAEPEPERRRDDVSTSEVAERILDGLDDDVEAAETCNDLRDVLVERARVLVDAQPSPFQERDTGNVQDALDEASRQVGQRMSAINCTTLDTRNRFNAAFTNLGDSVEQARTVAAADAEAFIERWGDTPFFPRWTYRDIVEELNNIVVEPSGQRRAGTRGCNRWLSGIDDVALSIRRVEQARQLLDTQQRGTPNAVKNLADARVTEMFEQLDANDCFRIEEPDFELQDLRDVYRDVSLAIIRPNAADLGEEVHNLRRFINNIMLPASERIGIQRAVPGTEDEDLRREGEVSGVRVGERGLLDEKLTIEFGPEVSHLPSRGGPLSTDEDGELHIDTGGAAGIPSEDAIEQVRRVVAETVFIEDLEPGVRFGHYRTDEEGDALARFQLNAGTPARSDDVGDLVARANRAIEGWMEDNPIDEGPDTGNGSEPPEEVGGWQLDFATDGSTVRYFGGWAETETRPRPDPEYVVIEQRGDGWGFTKQFTTLSGADVSSIELPTDEAGGETFETRAGAIEGAVDWMERNEPVGRGWQFVPGEVNGWELEANGESPTWVRDGLHLSPPANVPREDDPETVIEPDFRTFVDVYQSQTRHHVDVRWSWNGNSERSRRADVTVGNTRRKAVSQALELMLEG